MKLIYIILFSVIAISINAQGNRTSLKKGIQKCLDGLGDPIINCCVKTDANGEQYYIDCRELHDDAILNTAIGENALNAVTTGFSNYAIGQNTLLQLTDGVQNVGLGSDVLQFGNPTGATAVGYQALRNANYNQAIGIGYTTGTAGGGFYGTIVGSSAGQGVTGQKNVLIGAFAGYQLTTGTQNIMIGNEAGGGLGNVSNKLVFTNTTDATPLIYGDFAASTLDINGSLTVDGNVQPFTDDTRYIGRNDDDAPKAYKGIILKDQTTGTYYRIEINSGAISVVDLTD